MGWLFTKGSTLKSQMAECTKSWGNDDFTFTCLAKQFKGNVLKGGILWCVWEKKDKSGNVQRFISCYLLEYSRLTSGWGYKIMEERMHPFYYNCPLKYLGMVPESDLTCSEWREGVRQYHQERKKAA